MNFYLILFNYIYKKKNNNNKGSFISKFGIQPNTYDFNATGCDNCLKHNTKSKQSIGKIKGLKIRKKIATKFKRIECKIYTSIYRVEIRKLEGRKFDVQK